MENKIDTMDYARTWEFSLLYFLLWFLHIKSGVLDIFCLKEGEKIGKKEEKIAEKEGNFLFCCLQRDKLTMEAQR